MQALILDIARLRQNVCLHFVDPHRGYSVSEDESVAWCHFFNGCEVPKRHDPIFQPCISFPLCRFALIASRSMLPYCCRMVLMDTYIASTNETTLPGAVNLRLTKCSTTGKLYCPISYARKSRAVTKHKSCHYA